MSIHLRLRHCLILINLSKFSLLDFRAFSRCVNSPHFVSPWTEVEAQTQKSSVTLVNFPPKLSYRFAHLPVTGPISTSLGSDRHRGMMTSTELTAASCINITKMKLSCSYRRLKMDIPRGLLYTQVWLRLKSLAGFRWYAKKSFIE